MKLGTLPWISAATVAVAAGCIALGACSSSTTPVQTATDSGTKQDTGTPATDSGSPPADTGSAADTNTTTDTGSAAETGTCENAPELFAESKAGVYCPFSSTDGGSSGNCAAGQHCCETPASAMMPSTCVADGTACPAAATVDWNCLAPIDCAGGAGDAGGDGGGGGVCCGTGTLTNAVMGCAADGGPTTWNEPTGFTGTTCAASCTTYQVCSQQSDCSGGKTCIATKSNGSDFGYCM